jgi:hypothetical protein
LATRENVGDVRVFTAVEKREKDLDSSDAAVEAGCQGRFKLFLCFYSLLVSGFMR